MGIERMSVTNRALTAAAASALILSIAPVADAYVVGPTAVTAARTATKKYVEHDIHAWARPATYKLGACRVLFRRLWLAYGCQYRVHGLPNECLDQVTVAVKRLPDGQYRGTVVKWRDLRDTSPC